MQQPLRVPPSAPARLVVLASGTGSLLESLLEAAVGDYPARVVAVGADRDCRAVEIAAGGVGAELHGAAGRLPRPRRLGRRDHRGHRRARARSGGVGRIHENPWTAVSFAVSWAASSTPIPALLPAFPGAHAVPDALAYGVKVTGCSVHLVDAGTDTGPILAQQPVPVLDDDDEATLHERIKVVERRLLVDVLAALATRGVTWTGRKATIG